MHICCVLETLQPISEGGRFCFYSTPPMLGDRGLNAGEKPCFRLGKAKRAPSCPEPAQGCPSSRRRLWHTLRQPQPSHLHLQGEMLLEE